MSLRHKGARAVLVLLLVLSSTACAPRIIKEIVSETKIEYRDSTVWRDTTLYVPIPLEKDQAIVHVGDTSRLETSVAESLAWVDSTGFMHHTLENKRTSLQAIAKIPEHFIYTGVTTTTKETLTKIEYKDKPLNWWQKFRMDAFWWLLGAVVLLLLWTFRKLIF